VCMGQFVEPRAYHPLVDARSVDAPAQFEQIAAWVARTVDKMPLHGEFIERNCVAPLAA
jgi:hypothetical protein